MLDKSLPCNILAYHLKAQIIFLILILIMERILLFAYKVVNKHENKFGWDGLCQIFWENHLLTERCVSISEKKLLSTEPLWHDLSVISGRLCACMLARRAPRAYVLHTHAVKDRKN